ncbi:MAG: hypothetical protein FJY43_00925 [Betaproteobacteria bacterium]|nr:hypothetical protein [Betaproteobacteria bacterium]
MTRLASRLFIVAGNVLTVIGCAGLLLAGVGLVDAELFAISISSGIRVIASVAIGGCLLSAIGYGAEDYFKDL